MKVAILLIITNIMIMESSFLTSAWSGVHDGEAGGVRGEPGGVAKMINRF